MKPPYGLVFMPVYNDWESCAKLIDALDEVLEADPDKRYEVLVVDDGSTQAADGMLTGRPLKNIDAVSILRLKRNLGHQRAICLGLAHIHAEYPCTAVIQMDSDGEDDPRDVGRLLAAFEAEAQQKIVFARRTKRSERWVFRFFLLMYKTIHRILTGKDISIGNFSVIPSGLLGSLVVVPELWSHYAASVLHAGLPHVLVPSSREKRLDGESKMGFTRLVMHGLSAISVYSEIVATRLLIACSALITVVVASLAGVVSMRFFNNGAVSEWVTYASGLLVLLLLQVVMFAMIFSFLILNGRKFIGFIPSRDYCHFIESVKVLWRRN